MQSIVHCGHIPQSVPQAGKGGREQLKTEYDSKESTNA